MKHEIIQEMKRHHEVVTKILSGVKDRPRRGKDAVNILFNAGVPMRTKAIYEAMIAKGYMFPGHKSDLSNLYTALMREPDVERIGRGLWRVDT